MKKTILLSIVFLAIIATSCKEEAKKKETKAPKTTEKNYFVDTANTSINWTAYKTTDKKPVKGEFTKVTVDNLKKGTTVKETLNGLQFKIPVNSLYTKDTVRDKKLKKFFFGSMQNTNEITGVLHLDTDTSGNAAISMNGISHKLPFTYTINNTNVKIEAVMDLDNWQAQAAITALNVVCKDLHAGDDGISKTWNEVKINIDINLKQE
jgi:polyisoprenoid-binding protein YceI